MTNSIHFSKTKLTYTKGQIDNLPLIDADNLKDNYKERLNTRISEIITKQAMKGANNENT